jgi:hypothetical protein
VDSLYLVRFGVPFDVAFSLKEWERAEWVVIIAGIEGNNYDWTTRQWLNPNE